MLHCPSSRINLTNSDIADFERRSALKQATARLAQVKPSNVRLSAGPSRLTKHNVIQADDNAARKRADSCSSQAVICSDPEEEKERTDFHPPRAVPPPPIILMSDYDDGSSTTGIPSSSPGARESTQEFFPRARMPRRDGSIPTGRESLSPPSLEGPRDRALQSLTTHQTSRVPGPVRWHARSPRQPPSRHDFVLYEDTASVQAQIESQHLHRLHLQRSPNERRRFLEPAPPVQSRHSPSRPLPAAPGPPASEASSSVQPGQTQSHPLLGGTRPSAIVPHLNPGAPPFVPRTRYGASAVRVGENNNGSRMSLRQGGARASSTQSTSNLRVRSSFERNAQQMYRRRDSHGASNIPTPPIDRTAPLPQYRRRSHTGDHSADLPIISSIGERYPALRPPTSIPAPRRNSGSHRQVIFPRERTSRQQLTSDEQRDLSTLSNNNDRRRSSTQSKTPSLDVPEPPSVFRVSSPDPSSNSRSTPNLYQAASPAPLVHSRSSSLSWDRYVSSRDSGYRVPRMVSAASGISDMSDGRAHHLGHMPFEESVLSRGSPLDELLLDFSRMFPEDRPRSVGRSFQSSHGSETRVSLLSGDIFRQEAFSEHADVRLRERGNIGRHPLKAANDSSFSEEDAVALSLALPSPNMPSSSPITTSSPLRPTPPAERKADVPTPRSPATSSYQSMSSLTQAVQAAATPKVPVYDDRISPRTQPQTPADISKSVRQARNRATTMSREEVGVSAGGLFSPVIPERRPHRPYTYPSGTPTSMTEGAAMPARTGIVGGQSMAIRPEQRSMGMRENDIEGNLAGLDADRRIWMNRREEGNLDVTPPREGRYERFLR